MSIISDAELSVFLRGDSSLVEDPRAVMMAALASGIVSDYLSQEGIEGPTTYTDRIFDGIPRSCSVFLLPGATITAVSKVETKAWPSVTDWTLLDPATYEWNTGGFIALNKIASATVPGCHWPRHMKSIRVSYVSGLDAVPMSVKAVALGIAARGWTNPVGVLAETIGDYQVSYGAARASFLQLDVAELNVLGLYADWPTA